MQKVARLDMSQGDPVILALMHELASITGWDPVSIYPEYSPGGELGMSDKQIHQLAKGLSARLLEGVALTCSHWGTASLRQIVDEIRHQYGQSTLKEAARF
jgi:hypothetical protein